MTSIIKFARKPCAINLRFIRWASLLWVSRWDSVFFQYNNRTTETSWFRQLVWLLLLLIPSLASYCSHVTSLIMSWR